MLWHWKNRSVALREKDMAKNPLIIIETFPQTKTLLPGLLHATHNIPQKPQIRYQHLVSSLKYISWIEKPWSVALRSVALQFVRQISHAYMEPHELSFSTKIELFLWTSSTNAQWWLPVNNIKTDFIMQVSLYKAKSVFPIHTSSNQNTFRYISVQILVHGCNLLSGGTTL
jgi:hypothetical protein